MGFMMENLGFGLMIGLRDAFSANANRISAAARELDGTLNGVAVGVSRNMARIQAGAGMMGAGVAMLAGSAVLVRSTIDTQRALAETATLAEVNLGRIEAAAVKFTNQWAGITKPKFISAVYEIKSGLSHLDEQAMLTATSMAALTAKATLGDAKDMAATFSAAYWSMKNLDKSMSDQQWFEKLSGALSATVRQFRTTGPQMTEAMRALGPIASSIGASVMEQHAVLGTLQGVVPGAEAGTLYKAYALRVAEAGKALGLSFVGPTGQVKSLTEVMDSLMARFPDLTQAAAQTQIKEAFASEEAFKFVSSMAGNMKAYKEGLAVVGAGWESGMAGTLRMAQTLDNTIGGALGRLGNNTRNLMEALGSSILPVVTPIIQGAGAVMRGVQAAVDAYPGISKALLGTITVLGGGLVIAGALTMAWGTAGLAVATYGAAVLAAGVAFWAVWWPVAAVVAGLAGAVLALRALWTRNIGGMRDAITGLLGPALSAVSGWFSGVVARVRAFFSGIWGPLSAGIRAAVGIVGTAIQPVVAAFSAVGRAVGDVMGAFARLASGPGPGFFGALGRGVGMLGGAVAWVGGMLLRGLLAPVVLIARGVAMVATGISMAVQAATWGAGVLWSVLTAPGRAILSTVRALWNGVTAGFSALWQGVSAGFRQAFAPVLAVWKESVLPAVNAIRTAWAGLFQGSDTGLGLAKVVDALKVPMQWLLKGAGLLGQALGSTLGAAVRWGLVPALEFVGGVLGGVARMVEAVVQSVRSAWEFFAGLPVVKWFVEPTVKPAEQPGVTGMKVQTPQMIMETGGLARQMRQIARPLAVGLAGLSVGAPQVPAVARPATVQTVQAPASVTRPWTPLAVPQVPAVASPEEDTTGPPPSRAAALPVAPTFAPRQVVVVSESASRKPLDVDRIVEEIRRLVALADRPVEVRSVLDGREVARSVNRFNRDEQVKRYGQPD